MPISPPAPSTSPFAAPQLSSGPNLYDYTLQQPNAYYPTFSGPRSDRSRTAAGILQIILPGVGRMYLGYIAYGFIQLFLTIVTCGFLWIWSFIDGIIILTGGLKLDGYGRQLAD
jgi:TM2 domain-containing membrane protein YozV